MTELPYEGSAGHRGTKLYVRTTTRSKNVLLQRFALAKMADFSLLTADFAEDRTTFQQWLSVLFVTRDTMTSLGVYQLAFPRDDADSDPSTGPDFCWRRSRWDRRKDIERFDTATDQSAYLVGAEQIDSDIIFGRLVDQPKMAAAVADGVEIFRKGVTVSATERPDAPWDDVRLNLVTDKMIVDLSYSPVLGRCGPLESWASRWIAVFDGLDGTSGVTPNGEITVSYDDCFVGLAATLPKITRLG